MYEEELVAVNDISFRVREGEVFGFLGPNGAGKTTTMKIIQCVSPKTSGTLTVAGMDVEREPRKIKAILGVTPQETNLDPDFSVFNNLLAFSRYFDISKDKAREKADELIKFFQLEAKKDILIDKLSGGMKRRLLLARSMINDPRILIMDEPTVGLDPQARHMIWDQLKLLRSRGITIILTTHYMEEAAELCDRIVIMDNGKILAEGSPKELVERHVASSIIQTKSSQRVLACLKRHKDDFEYEVAGEAVHIFTDNPKEIMGALMDECALESTTVRSTTLEDVFLKLTGRELRE